jgi:hypothetical protein
MQNIPNIGLDKVAKLLTRPGRLILNNRGDTADFFNPEEYITHKVRLIEPIFEQIRHLMGYMCCRENGIREESCKQSQTVKQMLWANMI